MSGPDRICPGRAGRPGSLGVRGRESLISPGVSGRWARVGDPPHPAKRANPEGAWSSAGEAGGVRVLLMMCMCCDDMIISNGSSLV